MTSRPPSRPRRALALGLAWGLACLLGVSGLAAHADTATPHQRWDEPPTSSKQAGVQNCADFLFIGVRGSGEDAPYGPTVTRVRNGLARGWEKGTVRQLWLDYPAGDPHTLTQVPLHQLIFERPMPSTVYFDSAQTGGTHLADVLRTQQSRCPNERVILAGFSQGAQVITQALATTAPAVTSVVAAVLIGNPSHYPGQNVRELSGSAPLNATGLGTFLYVLREQARIGDQTSRDEALRRLIEVTVQMAEGKVPTATFRAAMRQAQAEIPPESYARTYSVCQSGDLVCDAGPAMTQVMVQTTSLSDEINRTRPIHLGYTDTVLAPTVTEVQRYLNDLSLITPSPTGSAPSSAPSDRPVVQPAALGWRPLVVLVVGAGGGAALLLVGYLAGRRRAASGGGREGRGESSSEVSDPGVDEGTDGGGEEADEGPREGAGEARSDD